MNGGFFVLCGALGLAGALAGALLPARARALAAACASALAAGVMLLAAVPVLAGGASPAYATRALLPFGGVAFSLDPLGALFVALSALVAIAAACTLAGQATRVRPGRALTGVFPLFVVSLLLVPAACAVTTFAFCWELMAVSSLVLVLSGHPRAESTREAAQWYAAMTHLGAAAIVLSLLLLTAGAGGESFAAIARHAPVVSPVLRSVAFLLALAGFSSKAGAVPLHVWLPRAHPEAPAPVSALMSGAMVNLGIYGILRVADGLLGGGATWWWGVVVALGLASALYGALHASTSPDLKRLLAYSTIDNLGLVLVGTGLSGLFLATGAHLLATVALVATLLHLVNHAAFKGTLFLAAGSVQLAAGTSDLDLLGGLVRKMPVTAVLFAVGSLASSALPPFGGFVSEWLLLESLLRGLQRGPGAVTVAALAGVAVLALSGGLTAVAFVKALGIGFLGQARSARAGQASEVGLTMALGPGLLALGCLAGGVVPGLVLPALGRAATAATGSGVPGLARHGLELGLPGSLGVLAPVQLALALLGALGAVALGRQLLGRRGVRPVAAWASPSARTQYSATSFAQPLEQIFEDVLRPTHDLEVSHAAESRYFVTAITLRSRIADAFEHAWYRPVIAAARAWSGVARRLQNGSVHRYLAFGFGALLVLLVVLG